MTSQATPGRPASYDGLRATRRALVGATAPAMLPEPAPESVASSIPEGPATQVADPTAALLAAATARNQKVTAPPPETPPPARPPPQDLVLLSYSDLRQLGVNYSREHLRRLIVAGAFPPPVALGSGTHCRKAWRRHEVLEWLAALPSATLNGYQKYRKP